MKSPMRSPDEIIIDGKSLNEIIEQHKIWLISERKKGSRANLSDTDLSFVDLSQTKLTWVDQSGADLPPWADQSEVDPYGVNLSGADLSGADLSGADLSHVNLTEANLSGANLNTAHFPWAILRRAFLLLADLSFADLLMAKLSGADLREANLSGANLTEADLSDTNLSMTNLVGVNFEKTKFDKTILNNTIFADCKLTNAINLDKIIHEGPSIVDINSIPDLDKLPYLFLKGVGFNDKFIEYYPSIFSGLPIQFYSCFISYSSKNFDFADRLKSEMQSAGLRTWFAPEDLKIGEKIRDRIDKAIMMYDKLMLILSKDSISSQWVENEVESALEKERKTGRLVLFPIRIDDSIFNVDLGWAKLIKNTRHIGDFTNWKDHDIFKKSFARLLQDLKEVQKS